MYTTAVCRFEVFSDKPPKGQYRAAARTTYTYLQGVHQSALMPLLACISKTIDPRYYSCHCSVYHTPKPFLNSGTMVAACIGGAIAAIVPLLRNSGTALDSGILFIFLYMPLYRATRCRSKPTTGPTRCSLSTSPHRGRNQFCPTK